MFSYPIKHLFLPQIAALQTPSWQSLRALDSLTFFLADVLDGLGPYLAIFLITQQHWTASQVGVAMAAVVIGTLIAQLPAGIFIDRTPHKRLAVAAAAVVVGICCVVLNFFPYFPIVVAAQALIGAAAAVMPPAIAGITLGLVGRARLARRVGRNEAFNHAGNVSAAVLAGFAGTIFGFGAIFLLVALMAVASGMSALCIRGSEIDHERARESSPTTGTVSSSILLFRNGRLIAFLVSMFLFHFANAAMLPLVGQKISIRRPDDAAALMSACIVAAQLVMVPVALLAGRLADRFGRKPIFLIAFAVLPIRGLLYTFSTDSTFLIAVQLLDGIGAGIFGVVGVLCIADLVRGTGRFNTSLAAMVLMVGLGSALSNITAGIIAEHFGYDAAFYSLCTAAIAALLCFWITVPQTRSDDAVA